MQYQINDRVSGFTVKRVRESAELNGTLVEMTHDKTGAQLCWMDNGERNKLFSIAFKTLPENSTGVFHILEHSVLCGSEKYPVKEPFVELLKSSMNTFLNAMTAPDWTMYPVSSRSEQDYLNLTGVYLDAVFAPRILTDPNIFYQEGWHVEQAEDGSLSYKGVVFNEMKGAMSGESRVLAQKLQSLLFPDNCYGYNSGGAPEDIPSLTYEAFLDTYRRHYHPSNARVFLDGAVPLEKTLALLDEYFSRYEKLDVLPEVVPQTPKAAEETHYYELGADEPDQNRGRLTLAKLFGGDRARMFAAQVLCDALAETNESPLKRAILSANLAQDVSLDVEIELPQPFVRLTLKDLTDGKADEARALIRKSVEELLDKGLDRRELSACINHLEFRMREVEEPQGLIRCFNALTTWLYGGDPLRGITFDEDFAALRAMLDGNSFEELLRELLLDETGLVVLHTLPSKTLGEEKRAEEAARLSEIAANWTDADRAANKALNEKLVAWQQSEDTPEQLATIPMLALSDVDETPEFTPTVEKDLNGVKLLYHPAPCHGIAHVSLYFALTDCTLDEIKGVTLLGDLLGSLPTAHYDVPELQRELKNIVGRVDFGVNIAAKKAQNTACTPYLQASFSVLEENLDKALELIREILLTTDFDQFARVKEIALQSELQSRQKATVGGHNIGVRNVMSHYDSASAVREATGGYTHVLYLKDFAAHFDEKFPAFRELMTRIQRENVCRARMVASVTAANPIDLDEAIAAYPEGIPAPASAPYRVDLPLRTGIRIPAQIGFAVQGMRPELRSDAGYQVAANLLSLNYLWNVVRVQGGAYGTGLRCATNGRIFTYSYRDPTPAKSLDVNRELAGVLRAFCESGEALDKYIISTVADVEPLRSPRECGETADTEWFMGLTEEDQYLQKQQILHADRETLLRLADLMETFAKEGAVCVVGHQAALDACENLTILKD